jgi:hypothetical protein
MSDTPPDRLAVDPKSPHYDPAVLARDVGVRFKGAEKNNVVEYCVSERWVRLGVKSNGASVKLQGDVEPYYRTPAPATPAAEEA